MRTEFEGWCLFVSETGGMETGLGPSRVDGQKTEKRVGSWVHRAFRSTDLLYSEVGCGWRSGRPGRGRTRVGGVWTVSRAGQDVEGHR